MLNCSFCPPCLSTSRAPAAAAASTHWVQQSPGRCRENCCCCRQTSIWSVCPGIQQPTASKQHVGLHSSTPTHICVTNSKKANAIYKTSPPAHRVVPDAVVLSGMFQGSAAGLDSPHSLNLDFPQLSPQTRLEDLELHCQRPTSVSTSTTFSTTSASAGSVMCNMHCRNVQPSWTWQQLYWFWVIGRAASLLHSPEIASFLSWPNSQGGLRWNEIEFLAQPFLEQAYGLLVWSLGTTWHHVGDP